MASNTGFGQCALCEEKATSHCGGCRSISFCSKRCQVTVWPAHKFLCSSMPNLFQQPPLTPAELVEVWELRNRGTLEDQKTPWNVQQCLPDSNWPHFEAIVKSKAIPAGSDLSGRQSTDPSAPNPHVRERAISRARSHVHDNLETDFIYEAFAKTAIWMQMSNFFRITLLAWRRTQAHRPVAEVQADNTALVIFDAYLRRMLILVLALEKMRNDKDDPQVNFQWMRVADVSKQRAYAALDAVDVAKQVKSAIRANNMLFMPMFGFNGESSPTRAVVRHPELWQNPRYLSGDPPKAE